MKKSNKLFSILFFVLSFILPVIVLVFAYAKVGAYPFGDKTVLINDLQSQYVAFLGFIRNSFGSIQDIFYSFSKIDGNMFSLFFYYLASPINLIVFLFDNYLVFDAVLPLILIKLGLSGFTFYLFLWNRNKEHPLFNLILSLCYALMSYNIGYSINIMWLDHIYLLPLVMIGIDNIVQGKSPIMYIFLLAFCIICNYYIGVIVLIFSCIYYVFRFFMNLDSITFCSIKSNLKNVGIFILATVLVLGLSCIVLTPVFMDLEGGKFTFDISRIFDISSNINFFELASKFFLGSEDDYPFHDTALPKIFCGIFPLYLLISFFMNANINAKKKIITFLLLLIFILSFSIDGLNLIWHGFNRPNSFPYRYAFCLSAFILVISFENIQFLSKSLSKQKIDYLLPVCVILAILFILLMLGNLPFACVLIEALLLICTTLIFYMSFIKKKHISFGLSIILFLIIVELFINAVSILQKFDFELRDNYLNNSKQLYNTISDIKSKETDSFYRIEKNFDISSNDPMMYNFIGLDHFSSNVKLKILNFHSSLGYYQDYIKTHYNAENTVFADSFYGVKYILYKDENINSLFTHKNVYSFPFAYLTSSDISNIHFDEENVFENQNKLYRTLYNDVENILLPCKQITHNLNNVREVSNGNNVYTVQNPTQAAFIEYNVTMNESTNLYLYIPNFILSQIEINGTQVSISGGIKNLGYYEKDEIVNVKIPIYYRRYCSKDIYFYYEDTDKLSNLANSINKNKLDISSFSNTYISGAINVNKEEQLLFINIPYNAGWHFKVDGENVSSLEILDCITALQLSSGTHTIEMYYFPVGLIYGITVCLISLFLTFGFIFLLKRKLKKTY